MSMTPITLANLSRAINKLKQYFVQIKDAVKSVNGHTPDSDGDININRVNLAGELESYSTQYNSGEFIQRTSGGTASIEDGDAWLVDLKGKGVKTGYVEEVLEMTVTPIPREDPITATIDEDAFKTAVESSQTITLTYTTEWSETPGDYGITVTGDPAAGDQIIVVYVKGELGTLTFCKPTRLISTGWNLYNHTTQMAKVIKYSDTRGYRVEGDYTSIQFSATGTGSWTDVTVTDHNFSVPSDGFVKLTGGNSSNTAVFITWDDWTEGYKWDGEAEGTFSAYSETEVDLSDLFTGEDPIFPYGLLEVGSVQDEINLNVGQAISRIQVMENTEENMTIARQSGREYDFDENYIFLAKSTADSTAIETDGDYTVADHGIEYFETTTVSVEAQIIYGASLKNKLERNVLTISQQTLNGSQQSQVRDNIDAAKKDISTSKRLDFNGLHSATTGVTKGLDALLDAELSTMELGDRRGLNLIPAGDSTFVGNATPFTKGRNNYGVLTKNATSYATYLGSDVSYGNAVVGARTSAGWSFRGLAGMVDITSLATFADGGSTSVPANTKIYYCNSQVCIYYQGVSTTHSMSATLFTLPQGFRPASTIHVPFVKNGVTYGTVQISTAGVCTVNQIGDATATGRIYFTVGFPIAGL